MAAAPPSHPPPQDAKRIATAPVENSVSLALAKKAVKLTQIVTKD
jgi:hypothetical protein